MSWRPCYSAPTPSEAHLVKGFLEHRGVPCVLEPRGASVYPTAALGPRVRVLVPEDWLAVARRLVERRSRPARPASRVVRLAPRRRRR
jgi:hypothetical protein